MRIDCIERGDKGMNTTKRLDFGVFSLSDERGFERSEIATYCINSEPQF